MQGIAHSLGSEEVPFRQLLDARTQDAFLEVNPQQRRGTRNNHIIGSINVPANLLVEGGKLKSFKEMVKVMNECKVDVLVPTVVIADGSCEDACVVELALRILGCPKTKVYFDTWESYYSTST